MSDSQFSQYNNLHIFAKDWRKYVPVSIPYDRETFRKNMQFEQYVKLEYSNSKTGRAVLIYLMEKNSRYANSSQDLRRLLSKIKDPSDVILITYLPFKSYAIKTINSFKHLRVKTYLHENFDLIAPLGALCYPHRILSHVEVNHLLNDDLCCYLVNLPKILLEDVQCIWIGAEVGDVIEIKMIGETNGEHIQYHVVVPKSGKIVSFRLDDKKNTEEEAEAEDEDIQEIREAAKMEDENEEDDEEEEPVE